MPVFTGRGAENRTRTSRTRNVCTTTVRRPVRVANGAVFTSVVSSQYLGCDKGKRCYVSDSNGGRPLQLEFTNSDVRYYSKRQINSKKKRVLAACERSELYAVANKKAPFIWSWARMII